MTGPEHYREAERLLIDAAGEFITEVGAAMAAVAQVHATLALAAATALNRTEGQPSRDAQVRDAQAWFVAAGTRKPKDGAP